MFNENNNDPEILDFSSIAEPIKKPKNDYDGLIDKYSQENGVDSNFVRAVIGQESGGKPNAKSWAGYKGLMQVGDGLVKKYAGQNADPYNPEDSIKAGTKHLAYLQNKYKGDYKRVLVAYNAGEKWADRNDWYEKSAFLSNDPAVQKGLKPRGKTDKTNTQNYVNKIYNNYLSLGGGNLDFSSIAEDSGLDFSSIAEPIAPTETPQFNPPVMDDTEARASAIQRGEIPNGGQIIEPVMPPAATQPIIEQPVPFVDPTIGQFEEIPIDREPATYPATQTISDLPEPQDLQAEYKTYSDYAVSQKQTPMSFEKFQQISREAPDLTATASAELQTPNIPQVSAGTGIQTPPANQSTDFGVTDVQYEAPTAKARDEGEILQGNAGKVTIDLEKKPENESVKSYIVRQSLLGVASKYGLSADAINNYVAKNLDTINAGDISDLEADFAGTLEKEKQRKANNGRALIDQVTTFSVINDILNQQSGETGLNSKLKEQIKFDELSTTEGNEKQFENARIAAKQQRAELDSHRLTMSDEQLREQALKNVSENAFIPGFTTTDADIEAEYQRLKELQISEEDARDYAARGRFLKDNPELYGSSSPDISIGLYKALGGLADLAAGVERPFISLGVTNDALYKKLNRFSQGAEIFANAAKHQDVLGDVGEVVGRATVDVPKYIAMSALPGGAIAAFGLDAGLQTAGRGQTLKDVGKETIKGAILGGIFHGAGKLSQLAEKKALNTLLSPNDAKAVEAGFLKQNFSSPVAKAALVSKVFGTGTRIGTLGTGTFTVEKAFGATNEEAFESAVMMTLFDVVMQGKKFGEMKDLAGKIFRVSRNGRIADVTVTPTGEVKLLKGKVPETVVDAEFKADKVIDVELKDGVYQAKGDTAPVREKFNPLDKGGKLAKIKGQLEAKNPEKPNETKTEVPEKSSPMVSDKDVSIKQAESDVSPEIIKQQSNKIVEQSPDIQAKVPETPSLLSNKKEPFEMARKEFDDFVSNTVPQDFSTTRTEDWGTLRGQGKRSGGAVKGAMRDSALQGKKTYTNQLGKLPELDKTSSEYNEDIGLILAPASEWEKAKYHRARSANLSPEEAIRWAIDDKNEGLAHRFAVEQALSTGKTVPEKVLKDYPDLAKKYNQIETVQANTEPLSAPQISAIRRELAKGKMPEEIAEKRGVDIEQINKLEPIGEKGEFGKISSLLRTPDFAGNPELQKSLGLEVPEAEISKTETQSAVMDKIASDLNLPRSSHISPKDWDSWLDMNAHKIPETAVAKVEEALVRNSDWIKSKESLSKDTAITRFIQKIEPDIEAGNITSFRDLKPVSKKAIIARGKEKYGLSEQATKDTFDKILSGRTGRSVSGSSDKTGSIEAGENPNQTRKGEKWKGQEGKVSISRDDIDFVVKLVYDGKRDVSKTEAMMNVIRTGYLAGLSAIKTNLLGNTANIAVEQLSKPAAALADILNPKAKKRTVPGLSPTDIIQGFFGRKGLIRSGFIGKEGFLTALAKGVDQTEAARLDMNLSNRETNFVRNTGIPVIDLIIEGTKRLVTGIDRPFKAYARASELSGLARLEARNKLGTTPLVERLNKEWRREMKGFRENPTLLMTDMAERYAETVTFQNPNAASDAYDTFRKFLIDKKAQSRVIPEASRRKVANYVGSAAYLATGQYAPFLRTPANIGFRTLEYFFPTGIVATAWKFTRIGKTLERRSYVETEAQKRAKVIRRVVSVRARQDKKFNEETAKRKQVYSDQKKTKLEYFKQAIADAQNSKVFTDKAKNERIDKIRAAKVEWVEKWENARNDYLQKRTDLADKATNERKVVDKIQKDQWDSDDAYADIKFTELENRAFAEAAGRAGLGLTAGSLLLLGVIYGLVEAVGTTDYDDEREKSMAKREAGIPNDSVKIGNYRFPYSDFPAGNALKIGINLFEQARRTGSDTDKAGAMAKRFAKDITELNPLTNREFSQDDWASWAGSKANSMTPVMNLKILQEIGEVLDEKPRKYWSEGFLAQYMIKLPKVREDLPESKSFIGERGDIWRRLLRAIDPAKTTKELKPQSSLPTTKANKDVSDPLDDQIKALEAQQKIASGSGKKRIDKQLKELRKQKKESK